MNVDIRRPGRIGQFKSPPHQTIKDLYESREGWKAKYMAMKAECSKLARERRALLDSQAHLEKREAYWKRQAAVLAAEVPNAAADKMVVPAPLGAAGPSADLAKKKTSV
jgi:hypothetical protein